MPRKTNSTCKINDQYCKADKCEMFGERWEDCNYKRNRGRPKSAPATIEHYRRMGLSNRGRKRTQEFKNKKSQAYMGRPGYAKGHIHTKETREQMSRSRYAYLKRQRDEMKL